MSEEVVIRKRNLYEIASEIVTLGLRLTDPTDETDFEDAMKELDRLDMDLAKKSENIIKFIKHAKAEIEEAKREEEHMRGWRKTRENAVERLRENLRDAMEATGTKKIAWTGGAVTLCEPKTAKLNVNLELLPAEFVTEKVVTTKVANVEKIEAALAAGQSIPGASMTFPRPHILVK